MSPTLSDAPPDHDRATPTPAARVVGGPRTRPAASRATALVLWTGYPVGPNVCRSLARAGMRVVGAHPRGDRAGRSSACPRPLRYPPPDRDPDGFLARVAAICRAEDVDAIVPLDEDIVRLLAERGADLAPAAVVGPGAAQYRTLCDKVRLGEVARRLGLDAPATVVVDATGPDGEWPALPSIVKPRTSVSEGAPPRMVATAAERDGYVAELIAGGHDAVVQERIVGRRWVVQSVRAPGVFEHVAHRVDAEWPRGAGLASVKRPQPPPPGLVAAARALLDDVDYRGPSGISFMERDGRVYPHDANLRLGATTGVSIHSGFDFPRRAVEAVLGRDGEPFGGEYLPGVYMRFDLEREALAEAWRTRRDGGNPGAALRDIASVALDRRGRLDPSPLDPFWAGPRLAAAALRAARSAGGRVRAGARA